MIFSVQYFRPPFPRRPRWAEDLTKIRQTGFDTIYVSVTWAWVEPEPGQFDFEDFDKLIEEAGSAGLKVILNTFAEIQPVWIHRSFPDASMIDHMGRAVVSSHLSYFHFGLTPGCCTDHSGVRAGAARFLNTAAARYASSPHIRLWDCWNEMRSMSQADGFVCFCPPTVARYRGWLEHRYGSLGELNRVWERRYRSWDDVHPAKLPGRTYTDSMLWQAFLTERTSEDLRWRYNCVREGDSKREIIAHAAFPSTFCTGEYFEFETALGRGNDWTLARQVDGFGCSHFPAWFHTSPLDYGARLESARCATGEKPYWIAELQGGAAGHGLRAMPSVPGDLQARWIWNGIARGAKAVNFWCWRDEVFSRESGGFGIAGDDGCREERLDSLVKTAALLRRHEALLDDYQPAQALAGIVFEPYAFHLDWASNPRGGLDPATERPYPCGHSLQGYMRAFERLQVPYDIVETTYADDLSAYRFLVAPWPLIMDDAFARLLVAWVRAGGVLLVESELAAFDKVGLYNYPSERAVTAALSLVAGGRRVLDQRTLAFDIDGRSGRLRPTRWLEALSAEDATAAVPEAIIETRVGEGRVFAAASFIGLGYWEQSYSDFEEFLSALVKLSGSVGDLECSLADGEIVQWRLGSSGDQSVLFVINHGPARDVSFELRGATLAGARELHDLVTGKRSPVTQRRFTLALNEGAYHVVVFLRRNGGRGEGTSPGPDG